METQQNGSTIESSGAGPLLRRWREPDLETPAALMLSLELKMPGAKIARMFSTVTSLSAPEDVTLQELHIEAFHPADKESESLSMFR
jgi:hypothetical protein